MSDHRPSRPSIIAFNPTSIRPQLAGLNQWVCWRLAWRPGKGAKPGSWTKEPINPATGRLASVTDPAAWGTLATAVAACARFNCDGIGFVLWKASGSGVVGIDLDKCRDPESGVIAPWALAIAERLDTYAEPSVTGTGIHLFVLGSLPNGDRRRGPIEGYDDARFFTVTNLPITGHETIERRDGELAAWHAETFPPKPKPPEATPADRAPLNLDDEELLRRCQGSERFRRLWEGDDRDYGGDASAADLAFANVMVRNGGDRGQADALIRRSPRARQKWDERRGDRTYGEMTLDQAFDGTVVPWRPAMRPPAASATSPEDGEPSAPAGPKPQDAGFLPDDVEALKIIILDLTKRLEMTEKRAAAAEAKAEMLGNVQSRATGIMRNANLGQERITAIVLAHRFGNRESVGDKGSDGLYRLKLADVARDAGISVDTAAAHIAKLEKSGVLRKDLQWCPNEEYVDTATGEVRTGVKGQFLGPVGNVVDFIDAVAQLVPEKKKTWGGKADRCEPCPNHPNATIIRTTVWSCGECGDVLHTEVAEHKPHDAGLVDDDLAATGTDGPIQADRGPSPSRGRTSIHRNGPGSHNSDRPASHPNAAGWSQARSFLGSDPPPDPRPGFDEVVF